MMYRVQAIFIKVESIPSLSCR